MRIYFYIGFCSLAVFFLLTHRLPRKLATHTVLIILIASLYVAIRVFFFDGKRPSELLCFFFFTLLGYLCYKAPLQELFFDAAFSAYVLHAVVVSSYILPLSAKWMTGDAFELRLILLGIIQIALAWAWDRLNGKELNKRLSSSVRIVILLSILLENIHLLKGILPEQPLSTNQKVFLIWSFIEVELLGMYMLFASYYAQREETVKQAALLQRQQDILRMKAEQNEEIRRMYHDMRHQIALIEATSGETATGLAQLLNSRMEDYLPMPESGNMLLDVLLNEKLRACRLDKIKLQIEENIVSADWIDPLDLNIILGNALENAMEAVSALPEELRWIRLKLHETESLLLIKLENPYQGTLRQGTDGFESTKQDAENHGLGLSSIRVTICKYKGELFFETAENCFVLKAVIPKAF